MFRTSTGQTGRDAYKYELAQIENSYRELNERMARLCAAMDEELPPTASSGRFFAGRVREVPRNSISALLSCSGYTDPVCFNTMRELIRELKES